MVAELGDIADELHADRAAVCCADRHVGMVNGLALGDGGDDLRSGREAEKGFGPRQDFADYLFTRKAGELQDVGVGIEDDFRFRRQQR